MDATKNYIKKSCECGCGRVGHFAKYATSACRQRAYRQRKKKYIDVKAATVSSWLIDMFGKEQCEPIFESLNKISGDKNCSHIDAALEHIVYLVQDKIRKETRKQRRIE